MATEVVKTAGDSGRAGVMQEIGKILAELARLGTDLSILQTEPGDVFRIIYDHWVERGGHRRGKPRNSVRKIKLWLGEDTGVRSLETKLAGRTQLQRQDAVKLLTLFLQRWSYHADKQAYEPYRSGEMEELAEKLAEAFYPKGRQAILLPLRSRETTNGRVSAGSVSKGASPSARPSREVMKEFFADSDALITVSRERTLIGPDPAKSMRLFRSLMREFHEIDQRDDRKRILIWAIDIGLRDDHESAVLTFLNTVLLAAHFQAIAVVDSIPDIDLWRWLTKRVVILVGSLRDDEIERCYRAAGIESSGVASHQPWFVGDRLFLEAVPGRWIEVDRLIDAFGREQGELWQRPGITAHLALDGWDLQHPAEVDPRKDLRFLFHAPLPAGEGRAGCIELGQPGHRWGDAFRLACTAAFGRLGFERHAGRIADPVEATALLRRQGWAVLTLQDFLLLSHRLDIGTQQKSPLS